MVYDAASQAVLAARLLFLSLPHPFVVLIMINANILRLSLLSFVGDHDRDVCLC